MSSDDGKLIGMLYNPMPGLNMGPCGSTHPEQLDCRQLLDSHTYLTWTQMQWYGRIPGIDDTIEKEISYHVNFRNSTSSWWRRFIA